MSEWLPAAGQFWPEPCCSSDPSSVRSAVPSPALSDRQPRLHPGPGPKPPRGSTVWSVGESGWWSTLKSGREWAPHQGVLLGSCLPLQHLFASEPAPSSPGLTSAPDFPQPWFIVPWQSCCSASLLPSPCCCCGSWDLVYCGPCWASWGPWPWALFLGMRCYTCCRMYVEPLPCFPATPPPHREPPHIQGVPSHRVSPPSLSAHSCLLAVYE